MKTAPDSRFGTRRLRPGHRRNSRRIGHHRRSFVRAIAVNVVTVPAVFTPLKLGSVVMLTVLGVLAAAGACRR